MKIFLVPFKALIICILILASCGNPKPDSDTILNQELEVSSFCKSLTGVGRILEDSLWTNWDMAPMYDEDGYHWNRPEIGCRTNSFYFKEDVKRMEKPHILWRDGKPEYLFMSLAKGRFGLGTGVVLKIGKW